MRQGLGCPTGVSSLNPRGGLGTVVFPVCRRTTGLAGGLGHTLGGRAGLGASVCLQTLFSCPLDKHSSWSSAWFLYCV